MRKIHSGGIVDRFISSLGFVADRWRDIDLTQIDVSKVTHDDIVYSIYESVSGSELLNPPRRFDYQAVNFFNTCAGGQSYECFSEERRVPWGKIVKAYTPGITFPQYKNDELSWRVGELFFELMRPLGLADESSHKVFYDTAGKNAAMPFVIFDRQYDAEFNLKRMIDCYVDNRDALEAVFDEIENAKLPVGRRSKVVGEERWKDVVGKFVDEEDFFRYRTKKRNPVKKSRK